MVPLPAFDDFEVFNEPLADSCRQDLKRNLHGKTSIKAELLEEDYLALTASTDASG